MGQSWQMQKAGDQLEQIIDLAIEQGPQFITENDEKVAVVVAFDEYQRMIDANHSNIPDDSSK